MIIGHVLRNAACIGLIVVTGCAGRVQHTTPDVEGSQLPPDKQALVESFEKSREQTEFEAASDQLALGNIHVAEQNLRSLLSRRPQHTNAKLLLAEILTTSDRPEEALRLLDELLTICPSNAAVHHLRGMVLHEQGHTNAAKESLTRAVELAPEEELYRMTLDTLLSTNATRRQVTGDLTP